MADIRSKAGVPVIGDFASPLGSVIVINQTTGDLSVLKTGDVIQTIIASPSSNAATATTLQTPRLINGVAFNGSADIRVPENTAVTQCTQAAGALTFTMSASAYDFRSTTLTDGTITTVTGTPANLVLPSGGTLGVPTTLSGRIIRVLLNVAGVMEQAVINIAGGNDLSETGVISTTAISAASTASNVFYSAAARTGVAYRVVGAVDAVNTAGAWSTPTFVQGAGGQVLVVLNSLSAAKNRYTSGNQVVTSAGLLTLAHGLGREPIVINLWLKFLAVDSGYAIGDKLSIPGSISNSATDSKGVSVVADATNLVIRYGAATSVFGVLIKGTGVGADPANTSVALIVEAFV